MTTAEGKPNEGLLSDERIRTLTKFCMSHLLPGEQPSRMDVECAIKATIAACAEARPSAAEGRRAGLEEAARVCDGLSGKHFNLIQSEQTEDAKHRRGAKAAALMECAAAIRALAHPEAGHAGEMSVPEGWMLVPIEPTKEMCEAGITEAENCKDSGYDSGGDGESTHSYEYYSSDMPAKVYRAMLQSAPREE